MKEQRRYHPELKAEAVKIVLEQGLNARRDRPAAVDSKREDRELGRGRTVNSDQEQPGRTIEQRVVSRECSLSRSETDKWHTCASSRIGGGKQRLELPWGEATGIRCGGGPTELIEDGSAVIDLSMSAGDSLILFPAGKPPDRAYTDSITTRVNEKPKSCGNVRLGLARSF